jgi:hypothetical protein
MTQFCDKHQTYYCYADNKLQCSKCHAEAQAVPAVAVQAEGSQAAQFAHDSSSLPSSRSAAPPCERIAEIRAREEKATPGPWFHWRATTEFIGWTIQIAAGWLFKQSDKAGEHDAEFVAHARADIPWLLAQHATLIAERDEAKTSDTDLREWLWLNHGCSIAALYGDDGELQCGNGRPHHLPLDFKRQPLKEILKATVDAGRSRRKAAESALDEARKALFRQREIAHAQSVMASQAQEAYATAMAQRDEARKARDWQPISTAPSEGRFLVYAEGCGYLMVMDGRMLAASRWPHTPNHLSGSHWTHWMPCPSPVPLDPPVQGDHE